MSRQPLREGAGTCQAPRKLLVLVTGDHECGGLALTDRQSKKQFAPVFTTKLPTGALVPVLAYGPKSELFSGIYDNTQIYVKMAEALGLDPAE